ncbi:hypothetical protein BK649P1_00044 [Bacteroides phage BK649P1]|nr:hypothetical protein BK649P1_00044 [Bacteroides phage BK649P1]
MNLDQIKINAIVSGDPEKIQFDGNHYKGDTIPLHEFLSANNVPFLEGNAIKYVYRHGRKNKERDIAKAIHCLQLILRDVYDKYLIGAELYTKEQYDELISQAKREAAGKETETTVVYTDKGIDINSVYKKESNKNVYVLKLREVKAVYIDYSININDLKDVGLKIHAYERNGNGVYLKDKNEKEYYVKCGSYIYLSEDGKYQAHRKEVFEEMFEPKG